MSDELVPNFVMEHLRAKSIEEIKELVGEMLDRCEDPDQLAEGLLFARGVGVKEIGHKLIGLTASPFHLINVMNRVPALQHEAWRRFMELEPSDIALEHVMSVVGVRNRSVAEMRKRYPLPTQPSLLAA